MHHLGQHRFKYYGCGEGIVEYNAAGTKIMVNCGKWYTQHVFISTKWFFFYYLFFSIYRHIVHIAF